MQATELFFKVEWGEVDPFVLGLFVELDTVN
jgi:hypothetical protein